jgi:hypothetical protein
VEPREVKIGSQTGYVWEDTRGLWKYTIAVPVVDRWYQLECSTMRKNATRAVKKRCLAILRSVRFRRSD